MSETARKVIELVNGQWMPSDYQRAEAGRELARRVERVLALHQPVRESIGLPPSAAPRCLTCRSVSWPCATIRALDGAE